MEQLKGTEEKSKVKESQKTARGVCG